MERVIKYLCFNCGTNRNFKSVSNHVAICKDCYENMPLNTPIETKYKNIIEDIDEDVNEKNRMLELDAINNYVKEIESQINVLFGQIELKINNLHDIRKRLR